MQQLEIQYFFPLTEQIPLDLDYTPCVEYQRYKAGLVPMGTITSYLVNANNGVTSFANTRVEPTINFMPEPDSVGYWEVTKSLHVWRKTKPNWLHRKHTEFLLGWKWKDK